MGYVCANFSLTRPLCSLLRPDVRDRQTDRRQTSDVRQKNRLMPRLLGAGRNNRLRNLQKILYASISCMTERLTSFCMQIAHVAKLSIYGAIVLTK